MTDDLPFDPEEQRVAELLAAEPPRPSPGLRRQVRHRLGVAFERQGLRRRSAVLVTSGTLLLVLALVLALSGPR